MMSFTGEKVEELHPRSHAITCSAMSVSSLGGETSLHDATWAKKFLVPWEMMPSTLINACENGRRPAVADIRSLVKVVGERIWKDHKRPG